MRRRQVVQFCCPTRGACRPESWHQEYTVVPLCPILRFLAAIVRAEVIAIGDELTSGQRIDTNSAWLSQELSDLGIRTIFHTTIADDLDACARAFRLAGERAEIVVMTGGLGPTADDLTRESLAVATDRELELREDVLANIQDLFRRRNRTMPKRNRLQAMFPVGSHVIENPHGTAPGIDLQLCGEVATRYFCLPGVPAEMKQMWHETVRPALLSTGAGKKVIRHFRLKCFGVGESRLEEMLPDLIRRGRTPTVGITVHKATITLRVTAESDSAAGCSEQIQQTIEIIRGCLGNLVYGTEDDELEHAVLRELTKRRQSLSTIEWATPGLLANWFHAIAETGMQQASEMEMSFYRSGISLTDAEAVRQFVGEEIGEMSSVNAELVTKKMAERVRRQFGTDYGLAVGPVTAPDMNDGQVAAPQLWLALAHREETVCLATNYASHPDILDELSSKQALNLVRKHLLNRAVV